MVTTHRFTIENGHAFFSTLFSRNRVEASVFLLSATNGNNRLVITRKFRTRDLLSPSRIIGGKKSLSCPRFFPDANSDLESGSLKNVVTHSKTKPSSQAGSHRPIPFERIVFFPFLSSSSPRSVQKYPGIIKNA